MPKKNNITLATQRKIELTDGVIGITPSGDLVDSGGAPVLCSDGDHHDAWSEIERADLADRMIARWVQFRDNVKA